jgi:hypothetical protein
MRMETTGGEGAKAPWSLGLPMELSPLAESMATGQTLEVTLDRWCAAFAADFGAALADLGVDAAGLALRLDARGHVVADDGEPDKPFIDGLFAADAVLSDRYRRIASDSSLLAASRIGRAYSVRVEDTGSDPDAKRRLAEDMLATIDHLETLAGRMAYGAKGLVSAARAFARTATTVLS